MADKPAGIFLIIEFDWPLPFLDEHGALARGLHQAVENQEWIEEVMAGSGGLGGERSSIWIFKLANYAALDRLLKERGDPVSEAFNAFFSRMGAVHERVREEVVFLSGV